MGGGRVWLDFAITVDSSAAVTSVSSPWMISSTSGSNVNGKVTFTNVISPAYSWTWPAGQASYSVSSGAYPLTVTVSGQSFPVGYPTVTIPGSDCP